LTTNGKMTFYQGLDKDTSLSYWTIASIAFSVAGADFVKPLISLDISLCVVSVLLLVLSLSWKPAARLKHLSAIGVAVFGLTAIAQQIVASKDARNPGIIAHYITTVALIQVHVLPLDATTRTLLALEAGLRSSNSSDQIAAARAALSTSDPGTRRDVIQAVFRNGSPMLREIAVLEAIGNRQGTELSLDPDAKTQNDLGHALIGTTLRLTHVDRNSGGIQGYFSSNIGGQPMNGTVSVEGLTVSGQFIVAGRWGSLLINVRPGNDFRLMGIARASDGQSVDLSIPLL
jgi:hypothetical protein